MMNKELARNIFGFMLRFKSSNRDKNSDNTDDADDINYESSLGIGQDAEENSIKNSTPNTPSSCVCF
jgi:hypothetical protein